jgi:hypothetical protein
MCVLFSTHINLFSLPSLCRLMGLEYNAASDVWSVAIMLIELWEKRFPYKDSCSSPIELVQRIEDSRAQECSDIIPRSGSRNFKRFLSAALFADPTSNKNTGCVPACTSQHIFLLVIGCDQCMLYACMDERMMHDLTTRCIRAHFSLLLATGGCWSRSGSRSRA